MFWKSAGAALAILTLGVATASAQDNDLGAKIYRLGDVSGFASERNDATDSDTELVGYRGGYRGGYHGGHYGGYRGGHYGGYHVGHYHSGYRGYYGGGYRHAYYGGYRGYYRPYISLGFGYPYYRSYYYSSPSYYYSSPSYYYYPSYCYYPISLNSAPVYSGTVGVEYPQQGSATVPPMRRADETFNVPPIPQEEQGTFPYNGGPMAPVPLPGAAPIPQKSAPIDPAQGRVVSIPAKLPKYTYSAYGQKPADTTPADGAILVKGNLGR